MLILWGAENSLRWFWSSMLLSSITPIIFGSYLCRALRLAVVFHPRARRALPWLIPVRALRVCWEGTGEVCFSSSLSCAHGHCLSPGRSLHLMWAVGVLCLPHEDYVRADVGEGKGYDKANTTASLWARVRAGEMAKTCQGVRSFRIRKNMWRVSLRTGCAAADIPLRGCLLSQPRCQPTTSARSGTTCLP